MSATSGATARCRLIFETHATSVDNEAGVASGWADVALSRAGRDQARDLGDRRANEALAAVFCSDLERAWRTAEIAFGARGMPIVRDERLRECDYGAWTRHPTVEIDAQRSGRIVTPFPDGESYVQVTVRVGRWLGETTPRFAGRTILVIGHRATFYAFEHLLRGVALADVIAAPWRWQPGWTYDAAG
jgi:broad specificity phosphatase PhoE